MPFGTLLMRLKIIVPEMADTALRLHVLTPVFVICVCCTRLKRFVKKKKTF